MKGGPGYETKYTVQVRNLSLAGVEFLRPQLWCPQPEHFFKISLNEMTSSNTTVNFRMQVCWVTDTAIGMKFHGMDREQKIKLNKILSKKSIELVLENSHFVM